ncbi:SpoIIE family protein phosphatase [Streptomyces subrutilus]|uniref:Phosphatase n=1 Tax=Streptomyces subrutilus TaxID=36818 RepID=A0A1E5PMA7_9ACTN|nr:SpoIIE family protein phosphatase [Streptomyces subrutilus]OEJ30502.1 phosphatase [Streptomyces subrutilus]
MTGDPAPADGSVGPEVLALARVVSRLRAELQELEGAASMTSVLERAKGVLMGRENVSAETAALLLHERAAQGERTLMEECWYTLAAVGAAAEPSPEGARTSLSPELPVSPFTTARYVLGSSRAYEGPGGPLARLAEGLARAGTPDDVAALLVEVLAEPGRVDAVMIYTEAVAGSLALAGHAGISQALAEQWCHIPPLSGVAALDAVAGRQALWLEEPGQDATRYLLMGDPPGRWPSRAWLPVPGDEPAATVVGFLRTHRGPFDAATRKLLRRAVRLCAGALRARGAARAPGSAQEHVGEVQRIFDALSGPATLLTPIRTESGEVEDFRIDAAAPQSLDVAGRRGKELVGRSVLETYPTVAGTALWDGYLATLATGAVYEGEPFVYEEVTGGAPRRSTYSVRASRLGDRLIVSWVRHDTDERESRRLADMQRLGNLGSAGWNLVTDTVVWSEQVYAVFDRDPALGPMRLEELPRHVLPEDLPKLGVAVRRLLEDGEAIDQGFRITTEDGLRHVRIVAEAQTDADGTPFEVHGFFQDVTALRDAELALLASERAVLVQSGMLQAERTLAARLQHTLLPVPEQSLELAGLRVDVAYLPADRGLNVGGDWYSAIGLPDDSALFVVGDVAGHGLAAVGTMAQLRFTAKGMAITGSALPDVLDRLNRLLLHTAHDSGVTTATMMMGRYGPRDHRLTWVRAGHLPPLLIRGGEARYLEQPEGNLLGAAFASAYAQAELRLQPGDHLLLYTDGLVEEPGEDIESGLAGLAVTARRLIEEGRGDLLARTLAARRPGRRDDICVVHVHLPGDSRR